MAQTVLAPGASLDQVRLIACPNPFSTARIDLYLPAGTTLRDMVRASGVTPEVEPFVFIWLTDADMRADPIYIPRENWALVTPKPGIVVTLRAAPGKGGGGGGGKNQLRTVLTIAVVAAAFLMGPALGTALGLPTEALIFGQTINLASAIGGAAISLVGNLLVNAIAPPPRPRLAELGGLSTLTRTSPTLAITGTQNRANRYGVVPRVYGRHKMFPVLAAHPYSETEGDSQYFRMLFDFGYGPLNLSDMRIGTAPLDRFEGVEIEVRQGYPSDLPITLYSNTIREDGYSLKISSWGGPRILETRDGADEILIDIVFQGLVRFTSGGARLSRTVKIRVEYRLAGSNDAWSDVGLQEFTEATEQVVRRGVRIVPPTAGRYELRFTRLSPDNIEWTQSQLDEAAYWTRHPDVGNDGYYGSHTTGRAWQHWVNHGKGEGREFTPVDGAVPGGGDAQTRDDSFVSAVRTVTYSHPVNATGRCLLALRIKANDQLNGVVDQFSAVAEAILPVWTGSTWTSQTTRHPAWAYLDVLRGAANKRAVGDARLDLTVFKSWADAAPTRTFDAVIDYPATVFELLSDIAASARTRFGMRDGKFAILRDVAQSVPIQHFTPRNSFGFRGAKIFVKHPHALKLRFINPERDWAQDEVVVYDDGYTEANATRFETLEMFGCTEPDQAWKDGRYHLAAGRLRPETYELSCDIDHLVCTAGDLVRVSHDTPLWGGGWARIKTIAVDGNGDVISVALDDVVTMALGKSYAARFRHGDGLESTISIPTVVGETSSLVFATPVAGLDTGDLAMFGEAGRETVDLLVKAIRHAGDFRATLALVDAAPEIHQADSGTIPIFDPQITEDPLTAAPAAVMNLGLDEVVRYPSGMAVSDVIAHWQAPPGGIVGAFEVYVKDPSSRRGDHWRLYDVTTSLEATAATSRARGETIEVAVLAVGPSGRKLALSEAASAVLVTAGDTIAPSVPSDLLVEETADNRRRFWWTHAGGEVDLVGFRLRANLGTSRAWESAIPMHSGLLPSAPFETDAMRYGAWTILIKAVDSSGNESAGTAIAVIGLGDALSQNLVQVVDYETSGWTGVIENGAVDGEGALLADDSGDLQWSVGGAGMWGETDSAMWGSYAAAMFSGDATAMYTSEVGDMWTAIFPELVYQDSFTPEAAGLFFVDTAGRGNLQIFYRRAFPDFMYAEDAESMWGLETEMMWRENLTFAPYTSRIQAYPEPYEIRAVVHSGKTQGRITKLKAIVDAPDVVERIDDLSVATAGARAPLTQSFKMIKNVSLTLQDDGGGAETARVVDKNVNLGPLVQCFKQSGGSLIAASGTVDVTVQGY